MSVLGCIEAYLCNEMFIFQQFRDLQSPISGEKKCEHFSSPAKKDLAECKPYTWEGTLSLHLGRLGEYSGFNAESGFNGASLGLT